MHVSPPLTSRDQVPSAEIRFEPCVRHGSSGGANELATAEAPGRVYYWPRSGVVDTPETAVGDTARLDTPVLPSSATRCVEPRYLIVAQAQVGCTKIFDKLLRAARAHNWDYWRIVLHEPGEHNLIGASL